MNWYKKAKSRTLYHGTSINNYDSIKQVGLVPDTGGFVSDSYAGEYEAAGVEFDPVDVTYATDKGELQRAVNAMQHAVMKMLNKSNWGEVTPNELKNYGMLVIIKEGEDYFEHRPEEEEGPYGDWQGETDNRYPAVEPGDYYSEEGTRDVQILIGNKMEKFLRSHELWPIDNREELLNKAIYYHVKTSPDKKDIIVPTIKEKIDNLDDEEILKYLSLYKGKLSELV